MERKSQVQIPKDLLLALFQYHLAGNEEYQPRDRKSIDGKIRQYGKTSVVYNIQNSTNQEKSEEKGKTRIFG